MTITNEPIPAILAYPGEEPLSEEQLEAFEEEALAVAADLGLNAAEAATLVFWPISEPEEESPIQAFAVSDDGLAEWAMRKLAEVEARELEVNERAAAWIEEIRLWKAAELKRLAPRRAFFEGHLTAYLRQLREESKGKVKSRKLPSGTIKSTGSKPKVGVRDEAAVVAWALENLEGEDLAETVSSKILVTGLRQHASVSQKLIGEAFAAALSCEHALQVWIPAQLPEGQERPLRPMVGETAACPSCEPEFGEQPEREIREVASEEIFEPIVRDEESGEEIPGAVVEPEAVKFSVKVGG